MKGYASFVQGLSFLAAIALRGLRGLFTFFSESNSHPGHLRVALIGSFLLTILTAPTTSSYAATVLFPTRNAPPTSDTSELARINYIEGLGHTILQIYSRGGTDAYNAALAQSDVVYISERVNTAEVSANLKNGCTGVVTEEMNLNDEFGIVSGNGQWGFYGDTRVYIDRSPDHYILQDFPAPPTIGFYDIFGPALSQDLQYLDDAPYPASYQILAETPDLNNPTLVAIETGSLLADGTTAAGRRVILPWMRSQSSAADFNAITTHGANILRRSLEWALQENECSFMQKRVYSTTGTPILDSSTLPTGSEIKFLLYINNKGAALGDINVQDILDPTFSYVPGTLQMDNTVSECILNTCSTTEEAAIFAAAADNTPLTDGANGDGVSFNGTNTINVGQSTPGNGIVNVNANSAWALLFSVTIN